MDIEKHFKESLTDRGKLIYEDIKTHCKEQDIIITNGDLFELSMVANAMDLYISASEVCAKKGCTQKPEGGGWDQVRPEYVIMKTEYLNVFKYGSRFGLNPADRLNILKIREKKKPKGFNLKMNLD